MKRVVFKTVFFPGKGIPIAEGELQFSISNLTTAETDSGSL